jgi:hypothetical protein
MLRQLLIQAGYDPVLTQYLFMGFTFGFKLGMDKPLAQVTAAIQANKSAKRSNHKSALQNPQAMELKLVKELKADRMLGPFIGPVLPNTIVSPLGLVPKKELGKFRVIHDLSYPKSASSVNSAIPKYERSVSYDSVDTAIALIRRVGRGAVLCKTDIEHAYKLMPIAEEDIPALGIRWFQHWLYDCTLPMGSCSGCAIFEKLSKALQFLAQHHGCGLMCHILDDFLMVTLNNLDASFKLATFLELCKLLGITMVAEKTEIGTTLTFMGIELDTVIMESRLPMEKLDRCGALLALYQTQRQITVYQLQSLAGLLNFACTVVVPGRAFLQRFFVMLRDLKSRSPFHKLYLSQGVKQDMKVWEMFLEEYNGHSMFLPTVPVSQLQLSVQWSVSAFGIGLVCKRKWAMVPWPLEWKTMSPLLKGLAAVLAVVKCFGPLWQNSRISLDSPLKNLVEVVNDQNSKESKEMVLVRALVLSLLQNNIELVLNWSTKPPSLLSILLSVGQVWTFKRANMMSDELPQVLPKSFHEALCRVISTP